MKHNIHFEVDRIDFSVKRLGLKHEPKTKSTIEGGEFNEISEAIVRLNKSFLPKFCKCHEK